MEEFEIGFGAADDFRSLEGKQFCHNSRGELEQFNQDSEEEKIGIAVRAVDEFPSVEDEQLGQSSRKEQIGIGVRAADEFLSPEDKLRGVFMQKLKGKYAIESALSNVEAKLDLQMLSKVVSRGNLGGEAMVTFFNWAVKQPGIDKYDIGAYHIVLKALGRRKLYEFMMDVFWDMKMNGISPDLGTIEIVMDSFIRANLVSKAVQFFEDLEDFGLESLNVIVGCLCKRSHIGAASSLLNRMKGKLVLNKVSYDCVISGWSRLGRLGEIETYLKEMIMDGFEPDCLTFGYLIEGFGRAGKMGYAVEVFEGMSERGCVPDTRVYNAMISNFVSVGDFDKAVEYYGAMLKNECEPNMETYTRLISGFLKARKVADAVEMFDRMLARGLVPSTGTITSFIKPLCTYGPPHAALMIYKKAKKVEIKVSWSAYKLLLMRLSRFGKCGMLLNMWDEMQKSGYSSDVEVYEYIINGLCNVGQLENAILVMEESMRKGFCPSKLICSKLNHKLMSSNKVESAYKLFLKVRNARRHENVRRIWRAKGWHF